MAIKEIFVFVGCFSVLSGIGNSVNIQCAYDTDSNDPVGYFYRCKLQNALNIKSRESAVIDSNTGSHESGKSNADVTSFYSDSSSFVIEYFPRNLENIFTNLKMIYINYGRLKKIQQSDLWKFSKLVFLDLDANDIEFLEDGLFAYNPEMKYIYIKRNKIIHIGTQVFDHLTKLTWLYLESNLCISKDATSQIAVKEVISQAKSNCQQYSDKHTIYFINDKVDHVQIKLSKSITDLSQATATKSEIIQNTLQEMTNTQNVIQQKSVTIQNSINQLINSQTQTCSAITENVSKVSQILNKMSQETLTKTDSTEIKNSINNVKSDMSSKFSSIGSDVSTKFANLNSYLQSLTADAIKRSGIIEQQVKQLSKSHSQGYSTISDRLTSAQNMLDDLNTKGAHNSVKVLNKLEEVKVIQQGIQQMSLKFEKSLKDLLGSHTSTSTAITDRITKADKSLSEIIKQKSDDIQKSMTTSHDELNQSLNKGFSSLTNTMIKNIGQETVTLINNKTSALDESLREQIIQKTADLDKSIHDRITNLQTSLNIALRGKEVNITNDVNSRTFNMSERITDIETVMNNGMMSMKDELATEITAMNATTNIRMTIIEAKISNLTSILQDFIQSSTRSSNQFQSELKDRLQITNYKIDKSSIIQDYSKSMLIGSCALLVTLVLVIIYKKILIRPDDLDY